MEKEFVPYELALKLKELGFDDVCLAHFNDSRELKYNTEPVRLCKPLFINAPLWQQAFDWLRETYELIYVIDYYDKFMWTYDIVNIKGNTQVDSNEEDYNTYEEARLECLKKLIKIIEDGRR